MHLSIYSWNLVRVNNVLSRPTRPIHQFLVATPYHLVLHGKFIQNSAPRLHHMRTQELLKLKWSFKLLAASYIPQELCGQLIYLIQIFTVDANSQSEVQIGQFSQEGQKQRSFGANLTGEGGVKEREGE